MEKQSNFVRPLQMGEFVIHVLDPERRYTPDLVGCLLAMVSILNFSSETLDSIVHRITLRERTSQDRIHDLLYPKN